MDETARAIGQLEATVSTLVKSVDSLTQTVGELRDGSSQQKGAVSVVRVAGSLAGGVCGGVLTLFGGPALAALLPLLSQPAR